MGKILIVISIIAGLFLASCSSEEFIASKHIQSPTNSIVHFDTVAVENYNGTGINFKLISKGQQPTINLKQSSALRSITADSTFAVDILTQFNNDKIPYWSSLLITKNQDSTISVCHYDSLYILANLKYDLNGTLLSISLPENDSSNLSKVNLRKAKPNPRYKYFYECVNGTYRTYMDTISKDAINDVTCSFMGPVCQALALLGAIDQCRSLPFGTKQ